MKECFGRMEMKGCNNAQPRAKNLAIKQANGENVGTIGRRYILFV